MLRKPKSPGQGLILCLASAGGSLTLTEITRALHGHWSRADMATAREQTAGLVEFSRGRGRRQNRPVWTATLTLLGQAIAATLQPGFQPRRFAPSEVRSAVEALILDHDQWGLQIVRDAEDARLWRQQEAAWKAKEAAKRKEREARASKPKTPRGQSQWFRENVLGEQSEKPEEKELFEAERTDPQKVEKWIPPSEPVMVRQLPTARQITPPSDAEMERNAARAGLTIKTPPGSQRGFCPRCHGTLPNHLLVPGKYPEMIPCPNTGKDVIGEPPTPTYTIVTRGGRVADAPTDPLIERIKKAGYTTRGNLVLYNNERYIDAEEWRRLNPHVDI